MKPKKIGPTHTSQFSSEQETVTHDKTKTTQQTVKICEGFALFLNSQIYLSVMCLEYKVTHDAANGNEVAFHLGGQKGNATQAK